MRMTLIRRLLTVAVVIFASGCVSRPADPPVADVVNVMEAFYGAIKKGDPAAAMAQIAPDAMFVESGRLETRAEYEKNHLPLDIDFEKQVDGKRGQWRVTFQDDTAWAIVTTEYDGEFDGGPVNFISAQLAVLSKTDNRWMIRAIHWSSRRL